MSSPAELTTELSRLGLSPSRLPLQLLLSNVGQSSGRGTGVRIGRYQLRREKPPSMTSMTLELHARPSAVRNYSFLTFRAVHLFESSCANRKRDGATRASMCMYIYVPMGTRILEFLAAGSADQPRACSCAWT